MTSAPPHRSAIYAANGVVATSQPLAASAGLAVLRRGGNAVDAAIATAVALTVVQPGSNDIGGDLFAIVWDGSRLHGLNASGRSPAALTYQAALAGAVPPDPQGALGGAQVAARRVMPARGWLPVTVPGAPAGWRDLHARFGSLPFADLVADAVGYARGGFPVSPRVAAGWARTVEQLQPTLRGPEFAEWGRVFTVAGGRAPRAGERFANPDAARTLELIARTGAEAFYTGEIADAIARHSAATGGLITAEDLAAHASTWTDPIGTGYHGHEVWEMPPNGQGIATLIALNILDQLGADRLGADQLGADQLGTDRLGAPEAVLHARIEAMKLGFADVHAYVADPRHVGAPVEGLLDRRYAKTRAQLIGESAVDPPPGDPARGGTVYLCTADSGGMMVSLIQSNYMGFGSHVVVPGYGFNLHNRGAGFALEPDHPNVAGPGKRPFHTIIPGFLTRGGEAVGPFGVMGGHMQPQGHLQLVLSTVDGGLDPQAALDAPRWYWHTGRRVSVEAALAAGVEGAALVEGLRRRGHEVSVEADNHFFGYGQAIWRLPGGGYVAGSEPRADGAAYGY